MKVTLIKPKKTEGRLQYYITGGTNETCTNPGCSSNGGGGTTPGGGCRPMGGNTVCH